MVINFRTFAKFCFIFVIIGFFMPMACDMNGFQIADKFIENGKQDYAFLLYALFGSAILGVIFGILLLAKGRIPKIIEWTIILVCIFSGLILYFTQKYNQELLEYQVQLHEVLQSGATVIRFGWIQIIICQIISAINKEI